jgi:transposase
MPISEAQYRLIERYLPTQRGNVSVANLRVINGILYIAEHDCRWRHLPKRFGNWHTVYTRMHRWSRNGVLERVFARLQEMGILRVSVHVATESAATDRVAPVASTTSARVAVEQHASAGSPPSSVVWLPRLLTRSRSP